MERKIKKNIVLRKLGATAMVAAMMATTAVPAFAASSANSGNNVATTNDLNDSDIIDMSKIGSLSICKSYIEWGWC